MAPRSSRRTRSRGPGHSGTWWRRRDRSWSRAGRLSLTNSRGLRIDILRRAVDIYLALAYPAGRAARGGPPPPGLARRGRRADAPARSPRSSVRASRAERGAAIYALRLGNMRYPHMKLQIQPWPNAAGFLLSVNTHDQVLGARPGRPTCPPSAPSRPRTSGSRRRSSRPGTRRGCPPSSAISATTSTAAPTPSPPPAAGRAGARTRTAG